MTFLHSICLSNWCLEPCKSPLTLILCSSYCFNLKLIKFCILKVCIFFNIKTLQFMFKCLMFNFFKNFQVCIFFQYKNLAVHGVCHLGAHSPGIFSVPFDLNLQTRYIFDKMWRNICSVGNCSNKLRKCSICLVF